MMRAMCGVEFKDRKISMDLILMLCMKETINRLAMANSVRWYGHVLRREGGHVLRKALDFVVEGRMGGQKGHGKSRLGKKVMRLV